MSNSQKSRAKNNLEDIMANVLKPVNLLFPKIFLALIKSGGICLELSHLPLCDARPRPIAERIECLTVVTSISSLSILKPPSGVKSSGSMKFLSLW